MHAKESTWLHRIRRDGIVSSSGPSSREHALRGRLPTIFIAFLFRPGFLLSLSLPSLPSSTRTSFLRAALRLRDVEEILGWMLVRLFQVFCVKILVIVVDVELEEEGLNEGRSIEWLSQTVAQRKDSFFYSNTSNPFVTSFLSFVVY